MSKRSLVSYRMIPLKFFDIGANFESVAKHIVSDFSSVAGVIDILDFRGILRGASADASAIGNLENYLHFSFSGAATIIHVSTTGGFAAGYEISNEDQILVLQDVDFTNAGSLACDQLILKDLLRKGQLLV